MYLPCKVRRNSLFSRYSLRDRAAARESDVRMWWISLLFVL